MTATAPFYVIAIDPETLTDRADTTEAHYRANDEIPDTGKRCRSGSRR